MKKKAFTLTELLVVVIIIGILSMVILPRFSGILETRKTAEAENIMRAVRTEQEARCTLDRNYTANEDELSSWPADEGNNYEYGLLASGIMATPTNNRDASYILYMDYGRGRICCDGADCDRLNKSYQNCDVEDADNPPSARAASNDETVTCAAHNAPTICNLVDYQVPCDEKEGYAPGTPGRVRYVVNSDCSGHDRFPECGTVTAACTNGETKDENYVGCGYKTWKECVSGKWEDMEVHNAEYNAEEKADCECETVESLEEPCDPAHPSGPKKTRTFACDTSTGKYTYGEWNTSACPAECTNTEEKAACDAAASSGAGWDPVHCKCLCQGQYDEWDGTRCRGCISNSMEEIDYCHYGCGSHCQSGGIWNNEQCKCFCKAGHKKHTNSDGWVYCEEDAGSSGDLNECYKIYGPGSSICSILDPEQGDPGDPNDPENNLGEDEYWYWRDDGDY